MDNDDDINLAERTRNRDLEPVVKAGFMEGMVNGQLSEFQNSFDKGYEQGLSFGLMLGKNDALNSDSEVIGTINSDTRIINCQLCVSSASAKENVANLYNTQKEMNDAYLKKNNISF